MASMTTLAIDPLTALWALAGVEGPATPRLRNPRLEGDERNVGNGSQQIWRTPIRVAMVIASGRDEFTDPAGWIRMSMGYIAERLAVTVSVAVRAVEELRRCSVVDVDQAAGTMPDGYAFTTPDRWQVRWAGLDPALVIERAAKEESKPSARARRTPQQHAAWVGGQVVLAGVFNVEPLYGSTQTGSSARPQGGNTRASSARPQGGNARTTSARPQGARARVRAARAPRGGTQGVPGPELAPMQFTQNIDGSATCSSRNEPRLRCACPELMGHASLQSTEVYTKVSPLKAHAVYRATHPRATMEV
jgi:hypothetical protein